MIIFGFYIPTPVIVSLLGVISGAIGYIFKILIDNHKNHTKIERIKRNITKSKQIVGKLQQILEITNADRVSITVLHNGGVFFNKKGKKVEFTKGSMIYEVVSSGISIENMDFKDVLLTPFSDHFMLFFDDKRYSLDTNETQNPSTWKNYLTNKGIKNDYGFVIENIEGSIFGFVRVSFIKTRKKLNDEQIEEIEKLSYLVSGYL
jgi:hypothetical protein